MHLFSNEYLLSSILCCLLLISSCSNNQNYKVSFNGEDLNVVFDDKIEVSEYPGDLSRMVYRDMLPSNWELNFALVYYRVRELTVNEKTYLLYAITKEGNKALADLRLATITNDTIKYNATLGLNLDRNTSNLIITINQETQTVELYQKNKLKMIYLANEGLIEVLNK